MIRTIRQGEDDVYIDGVSASDLFAAYEGLRKVVSDVCPKDCCIHATPLAQHCHLCVEMLDRIERECKQD